MTKSMCKKSIKKIEEIKQKKAKYKCNKCQTTAHKEKHLCKPVKIK